MNYALKALVCFSGLHWTQVDGLQSYASTCADLQAAIPELLKFF